MATDIPPDHPRARSLRTRELLAEAWEKGIVHRTGLIAHGRGEAFDYLLKERTTPPAERAIGVAARAVLAAERPVLCVNGNVVALAAEEIARLAKAAGAGVEVNLFHRTAQRVKALAQAMREAGVADVLGEHPDARIEGLTSDRALCSSQGVGSADLVLVPLEDGDRCEALVKMGKTVVTIELNPLTRTARTAHFTIVDELTRALPRLTREVERLRSDRGTLPSLREVVSSWDNRENLKASRREMADNLMARD